MYINIVSCLFRFTVLLSVTHRHPLRPSLAIVCRSSEGLQIKAIHLGKGTEYNYVGFVAVRDNRQRWTVGNSGLRCLCLE